MTTDKQSGINWHALTDRLRRYFQLRVNNKADTDDLVQTVLSKAYQQQSQLRDADAWQGWVFKIAHHALVDYYRRNAMTTASTVEYSEQNHFESAELHTNEVAECLMCMTTTLAGDERHLLQQIDVDGVSQKQLAAKINLPYSSLKSRVQRTRQKLKQRLQACCEVEYDLAGRPIGLVKPSC